MNILSAIIIGIGEQRVYRKGYMSGGKVYCCSFVLEV
jgi:hypothetical protein